MCVCVCVCVCERERERERGGGGGGGKYFIINCYYVRVYICVLFYIQCAVVCFILGHKNDKFIIYLAVLPCSTTRLGRRRRSMKEVSEGD